MTEIICVKCGSRVSVEDRAMAHRPPVPPWVLESSARFVATCSNRNQATGREHGIGEGATEEKALEAYAKDQVWGMEKIERLEKLEELMKRFDVERELLRITRESYFLRKRVKTMREKQP